MKSLCLILCLLAVSARAAILPFALVSSRKAATAGCTVNSGNVTNESFEGSDSLTWTDTGTVDRNAALSGTSPCSGLGSECAEVNWDGTGSAPYTTWDRGSALTTSTLYHRFYVIVVSHSLNSGDDYWVYSSNEGSTPLTGSQFHINIRNNAGQLVIYAASGASSTTFINISSATWYEVKAKYVNNATGQSELKIYSPVGTQVGSTQTWDTGNLQLRYIHTGIPFADGARAFRDQIDGIGIGDSDFSE
jgi:hypothetical protein